MQHYRAPNGTIYALEDVRYAHLLPAGSQPISDAEVAALPKPQPPVQSQIDVLERQHLLPRVVREYLLGDFAAKAAAAGKNPAALPAYVKLKALDDQIAALRAQL